MMTTDLANWTCIGKAAPRRVIDRFRSTAVVYFGAVESRIYGFESPSW